MQQSLFNQLSKTGLALVAALCNTKSDHAGFINTLRDIPALEGDWLIGDAAIAYLEHLLNKNQVDEQETALDRANATRRFWEARPILPHPGDDLPRP